MGHREAPQTAQAQPTQLQTLRRQHQTRWIVGVDGSQHSRHAALWAAAHAGGRANEVQLVAATSPMGAAATAVDLIAHDLEPSIDVPIHSYVGEGAPAALLLEASHDAGLLVVGTRGLGGFARLVLGSTSTQCATHSSKPVAVIPSMPSITPTQSIVVAFDGSANAIAALTWACEFAAPDSSINCVSVWDTTPIAVGADQFFFPEACDLAELRFEHLTERTIRGVDRGDITVRSTFLESQPRSALSGVAAGADLLVMGARGHGAIGSALLGSVSTWLLHHVTQPMVVVPHSPNRADDRHIDGHDQED